MTPSGSSATGILAESFLRELLTQHPSDVLATSIIGLTTLSVTWYPYLPPATPN